MKRPVMALVRGAVSADAGRLVAGRRAVDRQQVLYELGALGLPPAEYVVVGGAAMTARNIRDTNDIDLVVTPELFEKLAGEGWDKKPRPNGKPGLRRGHVEAYLDVNTEAVERSLPWLREHAESIEGIPFVDLETLAGWKRGYGRLKDQIDVALLESMSIINESPDIPLERSLDR